MTMSWAVTTHSKSVLAYSCTFRAFASCHKPIPAQSWPCPSPVMLEVVLGPSRPIPDPSRPVLGASRQIPVRPGIYSGPSWPVLVTALVHVSARPRPGPFWLRPSPSYALPGKFQAHPAFPGHAPAPSQPVLGPSRQIPVRPGKYSDPSRLALVTPHSRPS